MKDYTTAIDKINGISKEELMDKLRELDKKQKEFRRSLKHPSECTLRCSR